MSMMELGLLEEAACWRDERLWLHNEPRIHVCTWRVGNQMFFCQEPGCEYETCPGCGRFVEHGKHHPECPKVEAE